MLAPAQLEDAMNANEIFSLSERIAKLMADAEKSKQAPPQGRSRRPRNFKHLQNLKDADISELLQRKWRELDELTKVVEDRHKATKKEDKKQPAWSVFSTAVVLLAGYPIIFLLGGFIFWVYR